MKLIKTKEENLKENYLELHYNAIDEETAAVLERLKDNLRYMEGSSDGRKVIVALADIYYIETVDRRTYAYTKDMCVEIREALRDVLEEYENIGFVRISKSAIVYYIIFFSQIRKANKLLEKLEEKE